MPAESLALFTDQYELTMLSAALADGTAERRCSFEVFSRRLPDSRRFGVVAGTGRLLAAIADFRLPAGRTGSAAGRRRDRRALRGRTWPTTGSPATSTATPRASRTSRTRRS